MSNVYVENGFVDRSEYLESLAEDFGLSISEVIDIADVLGPDEDFDGLVIALQDYADMFGDYPLGDF